MNELEKMVFRKLNRCNKVNCFYDDCNQCVEKSSNLMEMEHQSHEIVHAIMEKVREKIPEEEITFLSKNRLEYQLGWVDGHKDAIRQTHANLKELEAPDKGEEGR